jgi:CheY-like chemotaxis protein
MNILIVDDEVSFRMLVKDHLSDEGFNIFLADDGLDGLKKLSEADIDLVISDLHMHRMDGLRFCAAAREKAEWRDIPFLFVSAYGDESTLESIREFHNSSFLAKGGPMEELVKWIDFLTTPKELGGGYSVTEAKPLPPVADKQTVKKSPSDFHILAVDDDEALRVLLTTILEKEGYKVTTAADGYEAMEIFQQYPFDLILLDIMMPTISGLEVLKFIKERSPKTKVVMLTAYSQLKVAVQTKELGADDFIGKPFMRPDLLNTIKGLLLT